MLQCRYIDTYVRFHDHMVSSHYSLFLLISFYLEKVYFVVLLLCMKVIVEDLIILVRVMFVVIVLFFLLLYIFFWLLELMAEIGFFVLGSE